jgi:hypothetical protein
VVEDYLFDGELKRLIMDEKIEGYMNDYNLVMEDDERELNELI